MAYTANPKYLTLPSGCETYGVPRMIIYKIFGTIDYRWEECDGKPFLGIGGEAEFGNNRNCEVCAANQWGIWIRGGLTF